MKPISILFLLILTVSFFACSKKENAKPVVATVDSVRDQVSIPPKSIYPYTDTFVGTLSIWYEGDWPYYISTDSLYTFYVWHYKANSIELMGSKGIQLEANALTAYFYDAEVTDTNNKYATSLSLGRLGEYDNYSMPYTFQLTGNQLLMNWDIWLPLIGACDGGEEIGTFVGAKKHC